MSNAFKNTSKNGIVEIELKNIWNNARSFANISIKDNGPGIDDEIKPYIFERYVHGSKRGSSGVGLHLSSELIKEHHGSIKLTDSKYGSEFILNFPVYREEYSSEQIIGANEIETNENSILLPYSELNVLNNKNKIKSNGLNTVVIVEDNLDLRLYLHEFLKSRYIVHEACNGLEGLKITESLVPDLIIADVMMPEMDGIEMVSRIKGDPNLSHIPIIMLTAKTDLEHQRIGFDAGVFDYVSKPFNMEILIKKIENVMAFQASLREYVLNGKVIVELKNHFTDFDKKFIESLTMIIEDHIDDTNLKAEFFAQKLGISRMQLHRKIKGLTGETTTSYVNMIRMKHAKNMFDDNTVRVQEVMYAVGISSHSYFNKVFKTYYGVTPSNYIKNKIQKQA